MPSAWNPAVFNWRSVLAIRIAPRAWFIGAGGFACGVRFAVLWLGNLLLCLMMLLVLGEYLWIVGGRARRERARLRAYRATVGRAS